MERDPAERWRVYLTSDEPAEALSTARSVRSASSERRRARSS